ncbi:MAG: class I SAM-dependent methyltransferase [Lachnospiraceae bacterium]|nr:class I SAM-dependent methyltransferase [Lachnospiraceae bacterium]
MWISDQWKDYEIMDAGDGARLERWGTVILSRPDPQVLWPKTLSEKEWEKADGVYVRSSKGGGEWTRHGMPDAWQISYGALFFHIRPFSFKHTGIFPEQAANWDAMSSIIKEANRPVKVLNLFAYTGGATCALLHAGAHVTHVDASKGMVQVAKENAALSGLAERPVRWLVDDCARFVARELRRGNRYDAILLDPPSYGRGPNGEVWKIEDAIYPLLADCARLLSDTPLFFFLNMYTTGLQPGTLSFLVQRAFMEAGLLPDPSGKQESVSGKVRILSEELGLPVTSPGLILPCGACCRVIFG